MIEIADSWHGRDGSPIVSIPVDSFEEGDGIIVISTALGGAGSPTTPVDDGGNVYTVRTQSTPDGTYDTSIAIADAIVDTVPTQVEVQNSAGGANDIGVVVLRVTHDGTFHTSSNYVLAGNVTGAAPATGEVTVGATTPAPFANEGSALYVAGLTHDGATTTFTAGSGWATVQEDEDASLVPYSVVSKVEITSGPQTHTWSVGASRDYSYVIAAYTELVPDPVLQLVTTAPSPSITGVSMEVTDPQNGQFPDPDDGVFTVLVHPPGDGLFVPTLQNAELLAVMGWYTPSIPPVDWEIERHQANGIAQNIEAGWWVWFDHVYLNDPLGLLEFVASYQLTAVAGGIGGVAEDIDDLEDRQDDVEDAVDAVESDVDAVEVLVQKLRVIDRTVYTSGSGTHTFDDDTASYFLLACGGGGGGGAADGPGSASAASGGGGGAAGVAQKMVIRVAESGVSYSVGSGGTAGTSGGAGGSGGNSSVGGIQGNGGEGGNGGIPSPGGVDGGTGGTASGGDMNSTGQAGSPSLNIGDQHALSGNGGASVMGGGGIGGIITSFAEGHTGGAGGNYGGGGGGAAAEETVSRSGGAGGSGIVIIEEYGIGV